MPSSAYATLRSAIRHRQIITVEYKGHTRKVCPHIIGHTGDGEEIALCYQFAGTSPQGLQADGSPQNWRCLKMAEITIIGVEDGAWHSAADYSGFANCVSAIDFKLTGWG
jgi:hypothetical protein